MNYWDELVDGYSSTVGGSPQIIVGVLRGGRGFHMEVNDGMVGLEITPMVNDPLTGSRAVKKVDRAGAFVLGYREYAEEFNRLYRTAMDIYEEAGLDCG